MVIGLVIFLSGVILTLLSGLLLFKRRRLLAVLNGTTGFGLLAFGSILVLILLNVHTYQRLTKEIELVRVEVEARAPEGLPIKLRSNTDEKVFYIDAQEWQLDARFLKWKPWAYLIGSEPMVRLETLSGRQPGVGESGSPNSYQLLSGNKILSDLGSKISNWTGMVDSYYGSSVYMPAVEGSVYSVSASISGLVARAENNAAKQAVSRWMTQ